MIIDKIQKKTEDNNEMQWPHKISHNECNVYGFKSNPTSQSYHSNLKKIKRKKEKENAANKNGNSIIVILQY